MAEEQGFVIGIGEPVEELKPSRDGFDRSYFDISGNRPAGILSIGPSPSGDLFVLRHLPRLLVAHADG